jgi:thiamine-phosphate pyrophosphorylase
MDSTIEAALRASEAMYRERDWDLVAPFTTADLVLDWSESLGPLRGVYHGTAAARKMFERWSEAFSEMRWTHHWTRRFGSDVLVGTTFTGRGAGSGVEVSAGGAELWTLQNGRVARIKLFQQVDDAWRSARARRLAAARLYFVCEARPHGESPRPLLDAALAGGADIVQLRDKELGGDDLVAASAPFREAAEDHGALFVLNDRPELVAPCGADGVHVGQDDAPVAEARAGAGGATLIGLSTHSTDQIDAAHGADGDARPDQISVGPIFPTPTKEGRPATGLELVRYAAERATIPWFAIGGIDVSNVQAVAAAGARRAVVVRAIRDASDPAAAARALRTGLAGAATVAA